MKTSPEATLDDAVAWLTAEAQRHVLLADDHAARAGLMATGSDRMPVNGRRRDQLRQMATEAAMTAKMFIGFAIAIRSLQPGRPPEAGDVICLPATFLRRCAAEDFPGQALFRLEGGEVVRAPLAFEAADLAPAQQDRWA